MQAAQEDPGGFSNIIKTHDNINSQSRGSYFLSIRISIWRGVDRRTAQRRRREEAAGGTSAMGHDEHYEGTWFCVAVALPEAKDAGSETD